MSPAVVVTSVAMLFRQTVGVKSLRYGYGHFVVEMSKYLSRKVGEAGVKVFWSSE